MYFKLVVGFQNVFNPFRLGHYFKRYYKYSGGQLSVYFFFFENGYFQIKCSDILCEQWFTNYTGINNLQLRLQNVFST